MPATMGLVIASPWALRALGENGLNWRLLSDVGQTYGAASAIIAAIALAGISTSIIIQLREVKTNRKNAQRGHHADLLRLAMDDPLYMECWGPYLTDTHDSEKQYTYVNIIVAEWYAEFLLGEIDSTLLKATASSVFMSKPGRIYWEAARGFWHNNYADRKSRQFHRLLEEAYHSLRDTPVSIPPEPSTDNTTSGGTDKIHKNTFVASLGFGAGILTGIIIGSRMRTRFRFRQR